MALPNLHNERSLRRPRRLWKAGLCLLFAVFSSGAYDTVRPPSGAFGGKIDEQKAKLEKIQAEINRHRAESKELKKEEASVIKQLAHIDREIELAKKYLAGIQEREALLNQQIDSLRLSVVDAGEVFVSQQEKLAARLRQMYKQGPNYRWEILFGSPNVQEMMRRYKFLGIMAERDAHLIQEVKSRKTNLEEEQAVLTESLADIAALKQERMAEDGRLRQTKKTRVAMLRRIRNEKSNHDQAIEELKASQERLQNLIGELERKRIEGGAMPDVDFARLKGRLTRPVSGKIVKPFGQDRHPKFGTVTFNNGVNIAAPAGTPIRAVAAGRVEFVDWIGGYGNCIILNHGDGYYTLYAHAAATFVNPGQVVSGKEVIAEVGDTGSLEGFGCHFEIRKSKKPLNPMEWFRK